MKLLKDLQDTSIFSYDIDNDSFAIDDIELSLPYCETLSEYFKECLDDKFVIDDLAFIFEMSRTRSISPCSLMLGMIYLKRLKDNKGRSKTILSNMELCLISIILASKYLVDEGETESLYNDDWTQVTNIPIKEINKMEREMLKDLDWQLYVKPSEYEKFNDKFNLRLTVKKIKHQNGICTYSDLAYLLKNLTFLKFTREQLNYLSKILVTCSITLIYTVYSSFLAFNLYIYMRNTFIMEKEMKLIEYTNTLNNSYFILNRLNDTLIDSINISRENSYYYIY